MQPARSLYEILQVDARAEPEVLEAAYRRLARKYHPDVSESADGARMKELNAAYAVLRDPQRRADYDALLVPEATGAVVESGGGGGSRGQRWRSGRSATSRSRQASRWRWISSPGARSTSSGTCSDPTQARCSYGAIVRRGWSRSSPTIAAGTSARSARS